MAGVLTIGRVAVPEVQLSNVSDVSHSGGGSLSISGRVPTGDARAAAAVRAALIGLEENPDEPVVPVTFSEDPTLDGWVSVDQVSTSVSAGGLETGWWEFQVGASYGRNRGLGRWDAVVQGTVRSNSFGWQPSACTPWWAVPDAATGFFWVNGNTDVRSVIATASGAIDKRRNGATFNGFPTWTLHPSVQYAGAAVMEQRVRDSAIWVPIVGRRTAGNLDSGGWRIGNGIVRLTYEGGDEIMVEAYSADVWGWESQGFRIGGVTALSAPTIMRNDASAVVLECNAVPASGTGIRTITINVRRGDTWLRWVALSNSVTTWSVQPVVSQVWASQGDYADGPSLPSGRKWRAMSTYGWTVPAGGGIQYSANPGNLGAAWSAGLGLSNRAAVGDFKTLQNDRVSVRER